MSKVTSKLQLTVPKKIADQYGIRPGDELTWTAAGDGIRVQLARKINIRNRFSPEERLALYDQATKRRQEREESLLNGKARPEPPKSGRGWTREELYDRGFPR
jgi:AbrB family looped-hinge helix DNA binding protein